MERRITLWKLVDEGVVPMDARLYFLDFKGPGGPRHAIGIELIDATYFLVSKEYLELKFVSLRKLALAILRKVDPSVPSTPRGFDCSHLWMECESGNDICVGTLRRNYVDSKLGYDSVAPSSL
jgi:hypothetical protein